MFLTSGLFPDILYAFNSILAGVITGVFLLASLMQTCRSPQSRICVVRNRFAYSYIPYRRILQLRQTGGVLAGRNTCCVFLLVGALLQTSLPSKP